MSLLTILVVVLLVALLFGGFGHGTYGAVGWSPAAIILVVVLVLLLTGHLHR